MPENNTQQNGADAAIKSTTPPASIMQEAPEVPKKSFTTKMAGLMHNKGLLIGAVVVIIAAIVGVSVLFGLNATDQYQGLIKKIEQDTVELNTN